MFLKFSKKGNKHLEALNIHGLLMTKSVIFTHTQKKKEDYACVSDWPFPAFRIENLKKEIWFTEKKTFRDLKNNTISQTLCFYLYYWYFRSLSFSLSPTPTPQQ